MEYRKLGNSTLNVSAVGFGTWAAGNDYWGTVDDAESIKAIQAAIDSGINLIDTAPAYGAGHSEEVVGKALRGRREKVVIATKCGTLRENGAYIRNLTPQSLFREIDDSLRRLGVDVIDLWQIHWPDPDTPMEQTLEAVQRIKEQGKFRFFGVSNFGIELMDTVREVREITSLQPQFSLLKRSIADDVLPYCKEHTIGVLSYGTLAGGMLTGKFREPPAFTEGDNRNKFYPFFREPVFGTVRTAISTLERIAADRGKSVAQVAINWTLSQPGITSTLVGAKNIDQATQNAGAGNFALTKDELEAIDKAFRSIGF